MKPIHALFAVAVLCILGSTSPAFAQIDIKPTNERGEVALVVDFEVKPGFEAEFERAFRRSVICSRLEPGNITFDFHAVVDAPGRYVLYEIWRNPDAVRTHFETPYTKDLFALFERALAKPLTEGGLRFISEPVPAGRTPPAATNPASRPECR